MDRRNCLLDFYPFYAEQDVFNNFGCTLDEVTSDPSGVVIPAQAGIQQPRESVDPRLRGGDSERQVQGQSWRDFKYVWLGILLSFGLSTASCPAQEVPSRLMDELNWMEFKEIVPAKVKTVLLTTGTLEPHGVANNGADNLAPVSIAEAIAPEVNALIAPHIPYGVTGSMGPYPGATHIPPEVYAPYVRAVLEGLVRNGFKNLIIINGHGGDQTQILSKLTQEAGLQYHVNTLVINWWAACSDAAVEVFGNTGGHAGENETAIIQAINPKLVHRDRYSDAMTTPFPPPGSWSATPFPSSIGLYEKGKGAPHDFDQKKADEYFHRVNACVAGLVKDTLKKWTLAGFN